MKLRLHLDCKQLTYIFGAILLTGSLLSGVISTDKRWMEWHFSRLGEGGTFSSMIFNVSLILAAIVVFILGDEITKNINKFNNISKSVKKKAVNIIGGVFKTVTLCLVVVSAFPFDHFPVVHNIFGYSMLFVFLYLCMSINNILPVFSDRFYIYGYSIIITTVICYILFLGIGAISLLLVEFIIYIMFYVWLILFTNNIIAISTKTLY